MLSATIYQRARSTEHEPFILRNEMFYVQLNTYNCVFQLIFVNEHVTLSACLHQIGETIHYSKHYSNVDTFKRPHFVSETDM